MVDIVESSQEWTFVIKPKSKWYDIRLMDIWRYRDLLFLFVKRDFISTYKQTILGPLWFFLQPILTTITFTVIFGNVAQISTDGIPPVLFYLAGLTIWTYFSDCITKTSDTFTANANVFGKVYFPRMTVPLSIVISNMIKLGIQFILFLSFYIYYYAKGFPLRPNAYLFLIPYLILLMGLLGLGFGLIISSLTTKYRDLKFLIVFGVQLLMYASPIVYPLSIVPEKYKWLILLNPITSVVETFKYSFTGIGTLYPSYIIYSTAFCAVLLFLGFVVFHKVEKSFMDTV